MSIRQAVIDAETYSNCSRAHVGCVIGYTNGQMTFGFNSNPNQLTCDHPTVQGGCGCLHAEVVAALRSNHVLIDFVAVSISPCAACAKVIALLQPEVVLALEPSRVHEEGKAVLEAAGIPLRIIGRYAAAA